MLREPRLLHAQAENHKGMKNLSTIVKSKGKPAGVFSIGWSTSFRLEMPHERDDAQLTYAVGLDREEEKKIGTIS